MADSVAYIRDSKTGALVPVKLEDETGSYTSVALLLATLVDDSEVKDG